MEDTYSESDVSLSPSQILERLHVLRQLQLMQRGKLQKQRLQYRESSEESSSITEIVSHFSNSTSYNTFRSLLESSNDISDVNPRFNINDVSQKVQERDLVEGVSVLNLSQESEFIVSSPLSTRSRASALSKGHEISKVPDLSQNTSQKSTASSSLKSIPSSKQISLDDMPILSPKKDFEAILIEKLEKDKNMLKTRSQPQQSVPASKNKKPFLRKGEGVARFGLKKNAVVIQNVRSLPWRKKSFCNKSVDSPLKTTIRNIKSKETAQSDPEPDLLIPKLKIATRHSDKNEPSNQQMRLSNENPEQKDIDSKLENTPTTNETGKTNFSNPSLKPGQRNNAKSKHPLTTSKGKTWAAVLTKEQNDFLRQLKQSDYYKNFNSPTKSVISEASCDETMFKIRQIREIAEQNMFDLLENKVSHDSFNIENSFINRFLKKDSNLECSGESTPLVMKKCLSDNPDLMHILPGLNGKKRNENSHSDAESCYNCVDCYSDACSSVSCCSCKSVDHTRNTQNCSEYTECSLKTKKSSEQKRSNDKKVRMDHKDVENDTKQIDIVTENEIMKANMADMNAKLIATSELLKDRLRELEDEIETFRKENASLAKLRDEVDHDRQKFYEEKATFEQKLNEEKVMAEYYLAEEKDKISKQKQMYERYVREMRGRLNKKDKDEVVGLKKEISDLKEEIRIKDAKSTSTIARLRNQIKIMEKEKKDLHEEVEKLKKQNKRIQHSNEVTRRLTNIKYLEEINKKLTNISSKDSRSEVGVDRDMKYKGYEIERQSRSRKLEPSSKGTLRPLPRAKSVPNLNVTSRYAKYFSQKDSLSQIDGSKVMNADKFDYSDDENVNTDEDLAADDDKISNESFNVDSCSNEDDNYLEKMYMERFKTISPKSCRSTESNSNFGQPIIDNAKDFFIQRSDCSLQHSKSQKTVTSPCFNMNELNQNRCKSPVSILSHKSTHSTEYISNHSGSQNSLNRSKTPPSSFNHSSQRSATVIYNNPHENKLTTVSPEPTISKTSLNKTILNPTELRKSDGSRELKFPNGNIKYISADGKYSKFVYYNGDIKENFYSEGRIKYFYAETKTYHTTHADGLEVLEFPDGQVEKRYKDGSSEIRLPNGSIRYFDPKNKHVREEWRFPDGAALTVSANGERCIVFSNGQVEVHASDHKRREFPDGTVKLVYNDGTSETRYASGRVRIKDKHGNLIMDSATS